MKTMKSTVDCLVVAGATAILIWAGCSAQSEPVAVPESDETRIARALSGMNLKVSTQDSVTYDIIGKIDNTLFSTALKHMKALNARHTITLNFRGAPFTDLAALSELSNLRSLNLSFNDQLRSLEGFPRLTRLKSLNIGSVDNLTDLSGLPDLPALQTLNLSSSRNLQNLSALSKLTALKTLDLSYNGSLKDLKNLPSIPTLETIDLSYCDSFSDLESLPELPRLKILRLYNTAVTPTALETFQKSRGGISIDR